MGTMVVSEEIEALEAQAIPPVRFLVVPRVLATIVMTVCVAILGNLMGVFGGLLVASSSLGITPDQYLRHSFDAVDLDDFYTGLIKAGVFGMLISSLACYLGLGVTGGAQGVGVATTRTVVYDRGTDPSGPGVHRGVLRDGAVRGLWVGSEFGVQGSGRRRQEQGTQRCQPPPLLPEPRTPNPEPCACAPPARVPSAWPGSPRSSAPGPCSTPSTSRCAGRDAGHPRRLGVRQVDAPALADRQRAAQPGGDIYVAHMNGDVAGPTPAPGPGKEKTLLPLR